MFETGASCWFYYRNRNTDGSSCHRLIQNRLYTIIENQMGMLWSINMFGSNQWYCDPCAFGNYLVTELVNTQYDKNRSYIVCLRWCILLFVM